MTNQDFIKLIAPIVQAENNKRNNVLFTSVVIAQACLETGYGKSQIMMKAYAVFGIKATSNWKGKVYNSRTNEVYNGITTNISAYFRAYDSFSESIKDYFDLICNLSRYAKAKNCNSYEECIKAIANGGYATDPNYSNLVISIIKQYNLYEYDYKFEEQKQLYEIGKNYILQDNMKVREGAGITQRWKMKAELTEDGKKHAKENTTMAVLLKGTVVTVKYIIIKNEDEIWLKIPSGYVAGVYGGVVYVK